MNVPNLLYKYRAPTLQNITNLAQGKLWIASPISFNDPFDCAYEINLQLSPEKCIEALSKASQGFYNSGSLSHVDPGLIQEQVINGLKGIVQKGLEGCEGICCFSEVLDDLLMWGHYADGHRGFCLEFKTAGEPLFDKVKPVVYSNELPTINHEVFTSGCFDQLLKLLLTKSTHWAYEKEWRVLHAKRDLLYGYDRPSLTAIYFGARMPEAQMQMIASVLEGTDTKLYRMEVSKIHFRLVPTPLQFTRIDYRTGRRDDQ